MMAFASLLAQCVWADITRDGQEYKWYFVGADGNWDNTNNWRVSLSTEPSDNDALYTEYENSNTDLHTKGHNAPHTGSYNGSNNDTPPGVTRQAEGKYEWTLLDGNIIPEGGTKEISAYFIEGWATKLGVYNGVTVTVRKIQKLQSGAGTKKIHVDATSKIIFNAYGGGTSNNDVYYYVANDEGVTWNAVPQNGGYTAYYYLTGNGSVKYSGNAGFTHNIKSCEATLSAEASNKKISKKLLVKIGGTSKGTLTVPNDVSVTIKNSEGTAVTATKVTSLSVDGNIGDYTITSESDGIVLSYVDYADADPNQTISLSSESVDSTVIGAETQNLTINVSGDCTLTAKSAIDLISLTINKAEGVESATLKLAANGGSFAIGSHTIGSGVTLDLATSTGIKQSTTTNDGSIRVSGGTSSSPVVINEDGAADTSIGAIKVAEGAVLKIYATNGNKLYNVSGEGAGSALVILSSGQNWGMKNGSSIRNCKITIQDKDFWFERASALDATVDVEIPQGRTLHLGNPDVNFTIGALSGRGAFSKDMTRDTLTIAMNRAESTYSGNFAGIPVTIAGTKAFTFGHSKLNTDVTIAAGATAKLANTDEINFADAKTIDISGTLDCGNTRQTLAAAAGAANIILRDGGKITGAGATNSQQLTCGLDVYADATIKVAGAATIATPISVTESTAVLKIAKNDGATTASVALDDVSIVGPGAVEYDGISGLNNLPAKYATQGGKKITLKNCSGWIKWERFDGEVTISGTFTITDGSTQTDATIKTLKGDVYSTIAKSWSNTPKIYIEEHADFKGAVTAAGVHLSLAKVGTTYYYTDADVIARVKAGDDVINTGYTNETVPDGYVIVDGKIIAKIVIPEEDVKPTADGIQIVVPEGADSVEVVTEGGEAVADNKIPLTTGVYTISAKKSGVVIATETLGVVSAKAAETTTDRVTTAVAVPFKGKTVATLLNTALLNKDDTLMAWIDGQYEAWTLQSNKTWKQQPITRAGGENSEGIDPAEAALKCGQGVWVTTAGQIVTFGDMNATGAEVELTTGHNLVGNPTMEAGYVPASNTDGDITVKFNGKRYSYTHSGAKWTTYGLKKVINGEEIYGDIEEDPTMSVGEAFWFIKK